MSDRADEPQHQDDATYVTGATSARGVGRLWDPRVWGTVVGAVGATVFVMTGREALPPPWPLPAFLGWAAGVLGYVWFVFLRARVFPPVAAVGRTAGLVYLASVLGMLIFFRVGTVLLDAAGQEALRPALIVVGVGLHFLPFARAFRTPMFTRLGLSMAAVGAVGLGLAATWRPTAADAAAVVAGLVMLASIAADAARDRSGA